MLSVLFLTIPLTKQRIVQDRPTIHFTTLTLFLQNIGHRWTRIGCGELEIIGVRYICGFHGRCLDGNQCCSEQDKQDTGSALSKRKFGLHKVSSWNFSFEFFSNVNDSAKLTILLFLSSSTFKSSIWRLNFSIFCYSEGNTDLDFIVNIVILMGYL